MTLVERLHEIAKQKSVFRATLNEAADRINALEAALRDVSDFWEKSFDKPYDHAVIRTVRAALAPEQER